MKERKMITIWISGLNFQMFQIQLKYHKILMRKKMKVKPRNLVSHLNNKLVIIVSNSHFLPLTSNQQYLDMRRRLTKMKVNMIQKVKMMTRLLKKSKKNLKSLTQNLKSLIQKVNKKKLYQKVKQKINLVRIKKLLKMKKIV